MTTYLYEQVHDELRRRIMAGIYPPDAPLPSEASLRREFGVSQITVRRAVKELVLEGLAESRQGRGTFVRREAAHTLSIGLSSFTSDVADGRLKVARTLLSDAMIQAPDGIADRLRVRAGGILRRLERLDTSGGVPFSLDRAYIPPSWAGDVDTATAASPLFMHRVQRRTGIRFVNTEYDIRVESADSDDQRHLTVPDGSPMLVTVELVYDETGSPALLIESRYPAYRCRLSGTVNLVQRLTDHGMVGE